MATTLLTSDYIPKELEEKLVTKARMMTEEAARTRAEVAGDCGERVRLARRCRRLAETNFASLYRDSRRAIASGFCRRSRIAPTIMRSPSTV